LRKKLIGVVYGVALFGAVWLIVFFYSWPYSRLDEANVSINSPARQAARGERILLSIKARQKPVELKPVAGLAEAVTDEQLMKALCASLPWWNPPTVPSLMHELKLWGPRAVFKKGMVGQERIGADISATLLNDALCRERTTPDGSSYLMDSPFGIHVVLMPSRDAVGTRAEAHFGQLLAILGEIGVPLDTPVTTASGRTGSVADLLQDAILRFGWGDEIEFIGTAFALWLPPERSWINQFGNRCSFDELIEHLIDIPLGKGACGGTHVPLAVIAILQSDDKYHILSLMVRKKGLDYLVKVSGTLEKNQLEGGGWDLSWPGNNSVAEGSYDNRTMDVINVTGHHLEWIALAPESVRPSTKVIPLAACKLAEQIDALPSLKVRVFKALLPCSHAARALCLLRGQEPYHTWKEFWDRGSFVHVSPWSDGTTR
jgi:hypothetical protein